jgi:catechol 2,3-dioxygenase-like lactoylglutathione lyase family enzyme
MCLGVTIDVPDLAAGLAFYGGLLGLREVARPHPAYAVLAGGGQRLGLMTKPEGSLATPEPGTERRYARHWTPVHLDIHVQDLGAALLALERLGGRCEALHAAPGRPAVAFCSDPFGHGFCLLGPRAEV